MCKITSVIIKNLVSITTTASGLFSRKVPYNGKLLREKTFANFAVLWLFIKFSPWNLGGVGSFSTAQASNLWKFSPQKSYFLPICESFLPRKFPAIWYPETHRWFQLKCIVVARILHSLRACPITHVQYHVILYSMEMTNLCCNEAFWDSVWKSRIRFVMETKRVWPVLCKYKQWFMVHVQGVCIRFPWNKEQSHCTGMSYKILSLYLKARSWRSQLLVTSDRAVMTPGK